MPRQGWRGLASACRLHLPPAAFNHALRPSVPNRRNLDVTFYVPIHEPHYLFVFFLYTVIQTGTKQQTNMSSEDQDILAKISQLAGEFAPPLGAVVVVNCL